MPLDGQGWDETNPTDATFANQIDDYMRDERIAVRSRMAREHIWPSSQVTTGEAGPHTYITFQPQTGTPTLPIVGTQTQCAGIYFQTNNGYVVDSAGVGRMFFASGAGIAVSNTATLGAISVITGSGGLAVLSPGSSGQVLVSAGTGAPLGYATLFATLLDYGSSASASTNRTVSNLLIAFGSVSISGNSTQAITNLPFAGASSYTVVVSYVDRTDASTQNTFANRNSGSQFTIYHNESSAKLVSWIAFGV